MCQVRKAASSQDKESVSLQSMPAAHLAQHQIYNMTAQASPEKDKAGDTCKTTAAGPMEVATDLLSNL